eukprot:5866113-Ditylum_brightwellii.AAC.1
MELSLVEQTQNLEPQCENNAFLMEGFVKAGYKGMYLAEFNHCMMHVKATTLSDTISGNGKNYYNRPQQATLPQYHP